MRVRAGCQERLPLVEFDRLASLAPRGPAGDRFVAQPQIHARQIQTPSPLIRYRTPILIRYRTPIPNFDVWVPVPFVSQW